MSAPREQIHLPSRALAPFVEAVHWSQSDDSGTYPFQHLPDGRTSMHFRLTGERRGDLSVVGPRTRARFKLAHELPLYVRVVFRAGCA